MEESSVIKQAKCYTDILQSFDNASTILNDNASRFSIFSKYLYDVPERAKAISDIEFIGLYSEIYLLEYSRVTSKPRDERNFHSPYMLYQGIPTD